jgi:hypothetical protein
MAAATSSIRQSIAPESLSVLFSIPEGNLLCFLLFAFPFPKGICFCLCLSASNQQHQCFSHSADLLFSIPEGNLLLSLPLRQPRLPTPDSLLRQVFVPFFAGWILFGQSAGGVEAQIAVNCCSPELLLSFTRVEPSQDPRSPRSFAYRRDRISSLP